VIKEVVSFVEYKQERDYLKQIELIGTNYLCNENTGETFYLDKCGAWCLLPLDSSDEYSRIHPDFGKTLNHIRQQKLFKKLE